MKIFKSKKAVLPPKVFIVEITNHCNFRCSMCNYHSETVKGLTSLRKGSMDINLAKNLVDQMAGFNSKIEVIFHGAGEPLLYKPLPELLNYAGRYENLSFGFLTNGMLLTREKASEILKTRISWIGFSLDGLDKEKFERYRIGADYEMILENVLNFLELNKKAGKKVFITVNMTVQEEMKDEVENFINFWIEKADQVTISPYRPIGSRISELVDKDAKRIPCYMLHELMMIYWDGKAGLCCEDWYNDGEMGDLNKNSILEVWNNRKFRRHRRLHEKKLYRKVPLCENCNIWFNAIPVRFHDEKMNSEVTKNAWQYAYKKR